MKTGRIRVAGIVGFSLALMMCADPSSGKKDAGCPCLSDKAAVVSDSLAGLLRNIVKTGAGNGFPGEFKRSCDTVDYTYTAWLSVGGMHGQDSAMSINHLPLQVRILRAGDDLSYAASAGESVFTADTVRRWFEVFGTGDTATCLPNVENVIVDSIDQRILTLLDMPAWNLGATVSGLSASCDTLAAKVVLSDPAHPQTVAFDLSGKVVGDTLAVTGVVDAKTFTLVKYAAWCERLGIR